jgi:hypothetical protein
MNANELADGLEDVGMEQKHYDTMQQAATMLRQQQADYYSLLVNHDKLYAKVVEQQTEIEVLKAKTLTDEEILKMAANMFHYSEYRLVIDFAKAILRKAQEK